MKWPASGAALSIRGHGWLFPRLVLVYIEGEKGGSMGGVHVILRRGVNGVLALLKWPVALGMLFFSPTLLEVALELVDRLVEDSDRLTSFMEGFFLYLILWFILLKRRFVGSWLSTLEHELTHALFALLTLHKVRMVKTTHYSGGYMLYTGEGNWLILIAPYFFPTMSFILMALFIIFGDGVPNGAAEIFGASVSYHLTSTWKETHLGQSDLTKVGRVFALMVLPGANLFVYSLLFSFVLSGTSGVSESLSLMYRDLFSLFVGTPGF